MNKPMSDPVWLDLLVDNELSATERKALFEHLEQTNQWKACAIAFINSQALEMAFLEQDSTSDQADDPQHLKNRSLQVVRSSALVPQPASKLTTANWQSRKRSWLPTIIALFVGFLSAWMWQGQARAQSELKVMQHQKIERAMNSMSHTISNLEASQNQILQHAAILDERTTCLTEIIDNDLISIFDTPNVIPPLFLETLVLAGHDVDISRHQGPDSNWVHRLTVRKTPKPLPL